MALHPLRLRRTLTTLTTLHRTLSVSNLSVPSVTAPIPNSISDLAPPPSFGIFLSRWFRSSGGPLSSPRQYKLYKEGDEITEDTVLFEGCDYKHWLIVVDFPKDNKPPPEEMVRSYEKICAQGLGISVDEAKKRIYACSTSTYEGFQVLMSEEESEKFNDVLGVVFVLPDSYIDPVNKEYGGDKYENGVITKRRPPPTQYGRNQGGRSRQNYQTQQNYGQQPPMNNRDYPPRGGDPPYQGGYNQGGQGNYNSGRQQPPMNNRDYAPRGGDPLYQGSYNQGGQGNYNSGRQQPPMNNRDYALRGGDPSYQGSYNQGGQGNYNSGRQRDFFQGEQRNYMPPEQRDFRGDSRNSVPSQSGSYEQGPNPGYGQGPNPSYGQNFERGANPANEQSFRQGSNPEPGPFGQSSGEGQTYPGHGDGQGFSHGGQQGR
ncbi:multiple organellar RNA editing factor 1, mitochondrial-like [Hibiscus syriacus]|uniref:multiple organellar RNA editing factor 1, mitochondrial-like n=1 Tax=Hibiscus syriacus TaxID=106335 RepID=UPI00192333E9|nr:multiple organellar RNA editing factor 1, mitochondrial-like [Hibiscus syriacus]